MKTDNRIKIKKNMCKSKTRILAERTLADLKVRLAELSNHENQNVQNNYHFMKLSGGKNNFGESYYIYVGFDTKIRISDHSVGTRRMLNEFHVIESFYESDLDYIEAKFFPSRFFNEKYYTGKINKAEMPKEKALEFVKENTDYSIVGERTSKKGRIISLLEVKEHKFRIARKK